MFKLHLSTIWLLAFMLVCPAAYSQLQIRSAVSPEFPDGLHRQYLAYLADKLNAKLVVSYLPFARRLVELRHGDLDIMVGLKEGRIEIKELIYLKPNYESIQQVLFVRVQDQETLTSISALAKVHIAGTIKAEYFSARTKRPRLNLVEVSTLEQKIQLLDRGRAEGFIHFPQSTYAMLNTISTHNTIVPANFQPASQQQYYFAISKQSSLIDRVPELERILVEGSKNGDFARIRQTYYANELDY
ncbi:transporter substrate-binding domain-containing protein [Aliiglaciecola sp. LCG003]|uniref:substrate-binding periplasmic protein n=1 Tax=Aliiglaciecola sp. LCG003 TaxID=3053655 RepID=UPI00257313CA|nr:transporter substrate-binding domain-containing protein [Aliiglaciecola sp. LCG003]WJG07641.1 transporter substrate-binding domain-containing protein [Aliiglaciecola sp. LCG003]